MPTEILVIVIVAAIVLAVVFSWLGVRKLAQKHTRSAVAEPQHFNVSAISLALFTGRASVLSY